MIEFKWHPFSWVILTLTVLWFPLGIWLDESWGWENHFVENSQLLILFWGGVGAWYASKRYPHRSKIRRLWLWTLPIWALLFFRELSWGRCFYRMTPPGMPPEFLPGEELWFNPVVDPFIVILLVAVMVGFIRNFDMIQIKKHIRFNVFYVVLFFITASMVLIIENGDWPVFMKHGMLLEELGETIAYFCLVGNVGIHVRRSEIAVALPLMENISFSCPEKHP